MASHLLSLLFLILSAAASATKFTVGDEKAWNPGVNYTIWANKHKPFYVGDWLVFYYTTGQADVLRVNETAYEKCDASNPITNYSKGRSFAFELNETKDYYFICSYGYCYQGMKLAVHVQKIPPPSPPPAKPSAAARTLGSAFSLVAGVVAGMMLRSA